MIVDSLAQMGITWIDVVIVVIFIVSTGLALMRGFVREVVSIASWVSALVLAITQASKVAAILPEALDSASFSLGGTEYGTNIRGIVAFIVIFLAVLIIGAMINRLLAQLTQTEMLKGIDKMLGVIFGFLRASVVVVVLIVLSESFTGLADTDGWQQSRLIVPFEKLSARVLDELSNVDVDMSSVIPAAES
jgi:membrane protein required for colicin V production